jgi:hypothetical protein
MTGYAGCAAVDEWEREYDVPYVLEPSLAWRVLTPEVASGPSPAGPLFSWVVFAESSKELRSFAEGKITVHTAHSACTAPA